MYFDMSQHLYVYRIPFFGIKQNNCNLEIVSIHKMFCELTHTYCRCVIFFRLSWPETKQLQKTKKQDEMITTTW